MKKVTISVERRKASTGTSIPLRDTRHRINPFKVKIEFIAGGAFRRC